jgi:IS30 family transposase
LPKGTDFTQVTSDNVQWIEDKLNNRPRKCLGFKTPKEMMDLALAA